MTFFWRMSAIIFLLLAAMVVIMLEAVVVTALASPHTEVSSAAPSWANQKLVLGQVSLERPIRGRYWCVSDQLTWACLHSLNLPRQPVFSPCTRSISSLALQLLRSLLKKYFC